MRMTPLHHRPNGPRRAGPPWWEGFLSCPGANLVRGYGRGVADQGASMTPERLSGLDASFLYMETPTLHMHVAMAAVFDPSTVPGGYSFRRVRQLITDRNPLAPV